MKINFDIEKIPFIEMVEVTSQKVYEEYLNTVSKEEAQELYNKGEVILFLHKETTISELNRNIPEEVKSTNILSAITTRKAKKSVYQKPFDEVVGIYKAYLSHIKKMKLIENNGLPLQDDDILFGVIEKVEVKTKFEVIATNSITKDKYRVTNKGYELIDNK